MNPELHRNLWLELGVHRLVALPVALALVFMLVYGAADDRSGSMSTTAVGLFVALVLWGAVHVGDSVMGEARGRTWDGQRMSAIEPWTMTWGKLFGAPVFSSIGALICLMVYLAFSPSAVALETAAFLVASALLVHSVALIGSIGGSRKAVIRSSSMAWVIGIALVLLGPWMSILNAGNGHIEWWGRAYARIDFMLVVTALFAAWGVFGAHRSMSQELRVRTTPWAWVAFLLFVAVFIAGLGVRPADTLAQQKNVALIAGLIVSLAATYPMLLSDCGGAMAVRRLVLHASRGEWRRLFEELPLWPVTLALAFVFSVLTVVLAGTRPNSNELLRAAVLAPVPLFLLAVRDAAICLFFSFARRPRRAEATTIFYLVLLYWLVPVLLRTAGLGTLADLVLPPFWERPGFASIAALVQAVAMVSLATWRWRRNYGS